MPRLLPRLLKWLERNPPSQPDYRGSLLQRKRRTRRSLWRPICSSEEYRKSFSLQNRNQSLLLDHDNIIISPCKNARHKSLPPVVRLHENQIGQPGDQDSPREMTEQERQWWSSPYSRMLSSPLRQCLLSQRLLPSDFMIRLVGVRKFDDLRPSPVLIPNGILHPRFETRMKGVACYVTCWKDALKMMLSKRKFEKIMKNLSAHSLLSEQVSHQLRLRVLQELEMLVLRLQTAPPQTVKDDDGDDVVIRRLTRSEWKVMKEDKQVPWEGAACVLIVPPVNRDPQTKQRPEPNYGDAPLDDSDSNPATHVNSDANKTLPPLPPISTLLPVREPSYEEPLDVLQGDNTHLPHSLVPVYNGLSLFPSRSQRAALHQKLCEVLDVERRVRRKRKQGPREELRGEKPSHAFIVFSTGKTIKRADTVPLAVALWRIRMWEGEGWGDSSWLLQKPP